MRYLWENGGRGLVLASAFFGFAVLFTGIVLLATWLWPSEPVFAPLSVSDVTINSRVDGVDGPAVRVGSHYNGTLEICNANDEPQTITFVIQLERLNGPIHFEDLDPVEFPKEPGCETLTGDSVALPNTITPGRWRESSSAIVQHGQQKQTVSFVSDAFEVVP